MASPLVREQLAVPERKSGCKNGSLERRGLAFLVNLLNDEAGFGRGLGLLDLQAWEASSEAQEWEVAPVGEEAV